MCSSSACPQNVRDLEDSLLRDLNMCVWLDAWIGLYGDYSMFIV